MKQVKLTSENITSIMIKMCKKLNIILVLNDPAIPKDNGCAYGNDEIHLGKEYTSNLIFMAIFLHEYSHILLSKTKKYKKQKPSIFFEESQAWTLAQEAQMKYFGKQFTKSQGNFMLDCLSTYSKQHYNFSKCYKYEEDDDTV